MSNREQLAELDLICTTQHFWETEIEELRVKMAGSWREKVGLFSKKNLEIKFWEMLIS